MPLVNTWGSPLMMLESAVLCRKGFDPSEMNLSLTGPTKRAEIWKQKLKENKPPGSLAGKAALWAQLEDCRRQGGKDGCVYREAQGLACRSHGPCDGLSSSQTKTWLWKVQRQRMWPQVQLLKFTSGRWKLENNNHSLAAYVGQGMQTERDAFGFNARKHDKAVSPVSGLEKVLMKEQRGQVVLEVWFSLGYHWTAPEDGWLEKKLWLVPMVLALKLFLVTCMLSCFQIMPVKRSTLIRISLVWEALGIMATRIGKQHRWPPLPQVPGLSFTYHEFLCLPVEGPGER